MEEEEEKVEENEEEQEEEEEEEKVQKSLLVTGTGDVSPLDVSNGTRPIWTLFGSRIAIVKSPHNFSW